MARTPSDAPLPSTTNAISDGADQNNDSSMSNDRSLSNNGGDAQANGTTSANAAPSSSALIGPLLDARQAIDAFDQIIVQSTINFDREDYLSST